jgi:hypothetical protein
MKKIKLKKWLYMAGLLCMSVSCKKDPPPPTLAALCGLPNEKFTYKMTFENARADIDLVSGTFVIEGLRNQYRDVQEPAELCPEQVNDFIGKLMATHDFRTNKPQPYKCRVWGEIYNCDTCETVVIGNVYYIKLTKIEYQN